MKKKYVQAEQLEFLDAVFVEQRDANLPATTSEAIDFYRGLLRRYEAAVLAGDESIVDQIEDEAHRLAQKMNGGDVAIMGRKDAPAYVLMRETAAAADTVPMWGQKGEWTLTMQFPAVEKTKGRPAVEAAECILRIEWDGMFGFGFSTYVVDDTKPFVSETGYRSFIEQKAAQPVDEYVRDRIAEHVAGECKGRLLDIKPEYIDRRRKREAQARHDVARTRHVRRRTGKQKNVIHIDVPEAQAQLRGGLFATEDPQRFASNALKDLVTIVGVLKIAHLRGFR